MYITLTSFLYFYSHGAMGTVVQVPMEAREGVRSPGAVVKRRYQPPYVCVGGWEPNLCPLEDQKVLLTTEPFLWC